MSVIDFVESQKNISLNDNECKQSNCLSVPIYNVKLSNSTIYQVYELLY